MRLLTICPSRNRPDKLKRMLESYHATKTTDAEIIIYVADDDPRLEEYREVLKNVKHIIGPRRSLVKVLNYVACELYPNVEYYQEINDDHVCQTQGWDNTFIDVIETRGRGWGLACGNDLLGNEPFKVCRHPSAAVVSGNIIRTLGCFVLPKLDHLFTDTYLRDIAEGINSFYHFENVIIEHYHRINKKAENDDNYNWVYSSQNYGQSLMIYREWCKSQRAKDINKLIRARG